MLRENIKRNDSSLRKTMFDKKYIIIGILSGFLNGMFGSGGGSLFVPAAEKFMNIEEKKAHATALAFILPLAVLSAFIYIRHTQIPWKMILFLILGGLLGGFTGAVLLNRLSGKVIHIIFGAFMLLAAFFVFRRLFSGEISTAYAQDGANPSGILILWVIFAGFFSGTVSGMGIGGGTILIPALLLFFRLSQKESQAVNLIFFMPTALLAIFKHAKNGNIDTSLLKPSLLWGLSGAVLGALIAVRTENSSLRILFALFLGVMGIREIVMGKKTKRA